jgi:hypothetical protein
MKTIYIVAVVVAAALAVATAFLISSKPAGAYFIVDVHGERFTIHILDLEAIRLAEENLRGGNNLFPIGELARGDGGFNKPWSWHLKPETVRMVGASIELCDGLPSYVEDNLDDWLETVKVYCPWGGRVVARLS